MTGFFQGSAALVSGVLLTLLAGTTGSAAELGVASQVSGFEFAKLHHLPPAPKDMRDREECAHLVISASTPAGRAAESQGWAVTGEVPLGPYEIVSFVGTFEAGTSGTCALTNGNVGIFSGKDLIAILYAAKGSPLTIGKAIPFGERAVRILDGEFLQMTAADLRLAGPSGVIVTPPALEEKVCNGAATLPFIERLPIDIARQLLVENGWKPKDLSKAGTRSPGLAEDIAAKGIVEVEDCAGTGFGFCSYVYEGAAGELSVTTAGEVGTDGSMPWVFGYAAKCTGANP